jgi:predicted ATPase
VLRREGDRWAVAGTPEQWTIPTTLRGMIGARIDRLPAPAKALLQHAAVIGRFFGYRTLRALSDEPAELDRALAHLLRAELIREFAAPPERQYIFKHALTQEAAEGSLLAAQRRDLHGHVARHLESTLGDGAAEQAALLAHHWYHAAEWDKALEHTLAAAARARGLYDRPAARGHFWRALELFDRLPRTEDHQRLHADAIQALVLLPGFARDEAMVQLAVQHLDRALQGAAERGDVVSCAARYEHQLREPVLLRAGRPARRVVALRVRVPRDCGGDGEHPASGCPRDGGRAVFLVSPICHAMGRLSSTTRMTSFQVP